MLAVDGRPYVGHDGIRQYFDDVASAWSRWTVDVHQVAPGADGRVAIAMTMRLVGKESGAGFSEETGHVWTTRAGKLLRNEPYRDADEALRAVGGVAGPAPAAFQRVPDGAARRLSPEARAIDDATVADFVARHGEPSFAPLTIVIPSYGEAANIEAVLSEVPAEILGMETSVVVVVDGRHPAEEEGATARRVRAAGHHVAVAPVNRGQGAALRVGYRLARAGGARYIVSLDADGQYDATEIPRLLEPILAGEADFVSGSRRLGSAEHYDALRNAGVDVYARLISMLTRHRITDPANGLRAMRAELTADVPLTEPQYQASELEVGAIMRGWRVTERPNTMRRRGSGRSKKQRNLLYALQFGRVVMKTWLHGLGPEARRARARNRGSPSCAG